MLLDRCTPLLHNSHHTIHHLSAKWKIASCLPFPASVHLQIIWVAICATQSLQLVAKPNWLATDEHFAAVPTIVCHHGLIHTEFTMENAKLGLGAVQRGVERLNFGDVVALCELLIVSKMEIFL